MRLHESWKRRKNTKASGRSGAAHDAQGNSSKPCRPAQFEKSKGRRATALAGLFDFHEASQLVIAQRLNDLAPRRSWNANPICRKAGRATRSEGRKPRCRMPPGSPRSPNWGSAWCCALWRRTCRIAGFLATRFTEKTAPDPNADLMSLTKPIEDASGGPYAGSASVTLDPCRRFAAQEKWPRDHRAFLLPLGFVRHS